MSLDGGAKAAAKIADQTATKNNAFAQGIYDSNKSLATPTIDRGNQAGTAYNALLGLGGDQAAATTAFNNYQNSDGYQFRLDQGLKAVGASAAAKGGLLSGATLKGLNDYAGNSASSEFGQYLGQLQAPMTLGQSALNTLTGAGNNLTTSVVSSNNTASKADQNAALAGAQGLNSLIGTGLGLASSFATGGLAGGGFSLSGAGNGALKYLAGT